MAQGGLIWPPIPDTLHMFTQTNTTMYDTLWSEIADAPGEIFDIPEMKEFDNEYDEEATMEAFLNSNWDF